MIDLCQVGFWRRLVEYFFPYLQEEREKEIRRKLRQACADYERTYLHIEEDQQKGDPCR